MKFSSEKNDKPQKAQTPNGELHQRLLINTSNDNAVDKSVTSESRGVNAKFDKDK